MTPKYIISDYKEYSRIQEASVALQPSIRAARWPDTATALMLAVSEHTSAFGALGEELAQAVRVLNEAEEGDEKKSLADRWKTRFEKVRAAVQAGGEKAKDVVDKYGKEAVQTVVKIGDKLANLVKLIGQAIHQLMAAGWEFIRSRTAKALEPMKADIEDWGRKVAKSSRQSTLAHEIAAMAKMAEYAVTWVAGGKMATAALGAMNKESLKESASGGETLVERAVALALAELIQAEGDAALNEAIAVSESDDHGPSIPFVSKICKLIAKYPPFSQLHNIEHWVSRWSNKLFTELSSWLTDNIGAPGEYEFVLVGEAAGLTAGYYIKHGASEIAMAVAKSAIGAAVATSLPGVGTFLMILKWIAKGLWIEGIIKSVIKAGASKEKAGDEGGHGHNKKRA